jgi:hypothetical protein
MRPSKVQTLIIKLAAPEQDYWTEEKFPALTHEKVLFKDSFVTLQKMPLL